MKIEDEILVNKYGQELIEIKLLIDVFGLLDWPQKKLFLNDILYLIMQSKPNEGDIEIAIEKSGLKSTYTPCVLLRKGVANHHLIKIVELPETELNKAFVLLLNLFKLAYRRRLDIEKDDPHKWWYWDLSDSKKIEMIINKS
jgi:hypothetical protein